MPSKNKYAGFWIRFLAYITDSIILSLVSIFIYIGFFGITILDITNWYYYFTFGYYLPFLVAFAYYIILIGKYGKTIGKAALSLKVVNKEGEIIGYTKAFLRYIGYIVSGVVLLIGYLWIAFDKDKQGWHDKIAGTYVVKE